MFRSRFTVVVLVMSVFGFAVTSVVASRAADGKKPAKVTIDDPAKTGPDFALQGEYSGEIKTKEGPQKFGVQIIALPGGKFRAVAYPGGLPGDGWSQEKKHSVETTWTDGPLVFDNDKARGVVADGVITITAASGKTVAALKKVTRKSPTLGAKPPEGAVVLFDGSTAEHFEGGRMTDDGLLMQGVTSKQKFGGVTYHMEFRTPYMPQSTGQKRGNSGLYLQGRYEVQILDSFGLEGKNNECGGIYTIRDPDVNMCFPPLTWQTYDIDYTAAAYDADGKKTANARITVRHNGVIVHKDVELPNATRGSRVKEGPETGPIFLQDHGDPVRYRNIWLVEKK